MNDERPSLLDRWVDLSLRRSWVILAVAAVVGAASIWAASRLELRSDFLELLPTDSPSVVNLEHLKKRVASYATLSVAMTSPDLKSSMRFADDLVAELGKFPPAQIRDVDYNLTNLRKFYEKNQYLYVDLRELKDFHERLKKRIQEETEAGAFESLDDEPRPKTDLRVDEMKEKYRKKVKEQDRYPEGYYVTPDRQILAIFIHPPSGASGFAENQKLVQDVQAVIDRLDPAKYHPEMTVGFTGDVKTGLEERDALAEDMTFISLLALGLIILLIIVYYRSFRATILIGTPMLLGLMVSFAVAWAAIGYLNSATAFLSSIIAGNGINFMIMLAARFFEEIRARGPGELRESLHVAVRSTLPGTLVASAAASIAYGSLMLAGFRGFRQFGIIGGAGMLLCWVATFAIGPALIAAIHRIKPLGTAHRGDRHLFSGPISRAVVRHPRVILVGALLLTAGSILVTIPWAFDPFEYDFRNLRNRESKERGSANLSGEVDKIWDLPASPTPIVTDLADNAPLIQKAIRSLPDARSTIGDVKTLQDFLPKDQAEKLAILADIRELVDKKIDFLSAEDRKKVLEYRPPDDLRAVTLDDIPEVVARPFTESDGTRGRILYVYGIKGESLLDGKYLLKFAKFIRSVQVPGVAEMVAVGQPMVFADMIAAILHDGVLVTVAAVIAVLALLFVAYRRIGSILTVFTAVALGTLWMIGSTALLGQKLNFLNFVVIPLTLGIGVDYGANIYSRYCLEGPGQMQHVLTSTGGAVFLSALTTIIGYATLITSTNMALQSFGIIADMGEFACLAAAEIAMPALIVWIENGRRRTARDS